MEQVSFNGWEGCVRLANDEVELLVTTAVGPRIARFAYRGERNLFAEIEGQQGGRDEDAWMIRGGHRLWVGPEKVPETYELDNVPIRADALPGGVRTTQAQGMLTGVVKQMEIVLAAERNLVTIVHRLTNAGGQPVVLAPWALSVMAPDGMAVIPLPAKISHTERLTHNQEWSLWGYTDLADPRWTLGSRYLFFRQDRARGPNKLGLAQREGWVGYLLDEFLFVKRFDWAEGQAYPDGGCNFETYSDQAFLEVESLAPLTTLAPGASVEHTERWELFRGVPHVTTEEDADRHVRALIVR